MTKELNFLFSSNNKNIKNANYAKNKIISNLKKVEKVLDEEKFKKFQRDLIVNLNGGHTINVSIKDNKYKFLVGGEESNDNEEGGNDNEESNNEESNNEKGNNEKGNEEGNGNKEDNISVSEEEGNEEDNEEGNNKEEGNNNDNHGKVPINKKFININKKISSIQTTLESLSGKILNPIKTDTSSLLNNSLKTEDKVTEFITELNPVSTSQQNTEVVDGDGYEKVDEGYGSEEEGAEEEGNVEEGNEESNNNEESNDNEEGNEESNDNEEGNEESNNNEESNEESNDNEEGNEESNEESNNNEEDNNKGGNVEEGNVEEGNNNKEDNNKESNDNEETNKNPDKLQGGKGINNEEPPKKGFFSKMFSLIGGAKDYDSDGSEIVTSFLSDDDDSENDQFSLSSFEKMYDDQTYLFDEADSDEESLIDNAKQLKDKKYLNSLNVNELRSIMKDNNLQVSKKGSYLKKNEMIKAIKKNI